jgi:hypothetical protein
MSEFIFTDTLHSVCKHKKFVVTLPKTEPKKCPASTFVLYGEKNLIYPYGIRPFLSFAPGTEVVVATIKSIFALKKLLDYYYFRFHYADAAASRFINISKKRYCLK